MSAPDISLTIRIPKKLRDAMKKKAAQSNRSMNSEIVTALQEWTKEPTR